MRILIAEDERITRVSLARQLEAWGHAVTAVEDGEAAWERFASGEFDAVLTDWEMPRLSGPELIKRIRAAADARFVYIIMLTGRSNKTDLVAGIEAGADDFVAKPFDRDELRVRLLAGERTVRLERTLNRQNAELRQAGERMRHDLRAASRVQKALLPRRAIEAPGLRTAWGYVPTDELAGDAIGLHLIADRYLVVYVLDVSGHGVPAALLSVTAMHALAPVPEETSLLRDPSGNGPWGAVRRPGQVATELNRRFHADESDGRYFTMALGALDAIDGRLCYALAGHFPPLIVREGSIVATPDTGGLPVAIADDEVYADETIKLRAGDRVCLYSDGIVEQPGPGGRQFGGQRLTDLVCGLASRTPQQTVEAVIAALKDWAGGAAFVDDVSIVVLDWSP